MARKDVLRGLLDTAAPPARPGGDEAPALPRQTRGAIGAVSRSIADLKARAVVEIDPALIDHGGVADRLEPDDAADAALAASIAEYGQQVPVLLRPHPAAEGRFQVVYGRRRVQALRSLGQPVKALIRDLDDRALVLAQGQENTARRDLSFIEKVTFARQLEAQGYDRKVIGDALSIDKTLVSRMLSVAARIPHEIVAVIGAAPSVGRDRWLALADRIEATETSATELAAMVEFNAAGSRSDDRFEAAWSYLHGLGKRRRAPPETRPIAAPDGWPLGEMRLDPKHATLRLKRSRTAGFEEWLADRLPALFAAWQEGKADD